MIYHKTKQAAIDSGAHLEPYGFRCRAELEPYNGWVAVLNINSMVAFEYAWKDLLTSFEIDIQGYNRLRDTGPTGTVSKRKAPPPPTKQPKGQKDETEATWQEGDELPW